MESVTRKVKRLVEKNKTNCPFTIAQNLGIAVVYENLGNTLGYFSKVFRFKFIHINENTTDKQKAFICSHELGHAILHPDANTPFLKSSTLFSTDRIEVEANTFAVSLLFSKNHNNTPLLEYEVFEEYGISKKMINSILEKDFF